jgi:low affinity Fe/Cu permease
VDDFLCAFSGLADKLTSSILFLLAFNAGLALLWMSFGVDVANIFISIITAEIVLIGAGAARRGNKALHGKLNAIIHSLDNASDDLIGIEKKSEKIIDQTTL